MELENKWVLVVILAALFLLIAFIFVISTNRINPAPSTTTQLEECKTLIFNGRDKTNLVFFSTERVTDRYIKALLNTKPFSDYQEEFNAYYIDDYDVGSECEYYQGVALLCYSKEILEKAASCPNDYITITRREDPKIRSSAYFNVMSVNTALPDSVFIHEWGHVFANLAEEYIPAKIPRGSKNCVGKCSDFEGEKDGCFLECSKTSYYRSIEEGVMRTLNSNRYGIFNENNMEELILENKEKKSSIADSIVNSPVDCSQERYYIIEGEIDKNNVKIDEKNLKVGCAPGVTGVGTFSYSVKLEDESSTAQVKFNPNYIFTATQLTDEDTLSGEIYEEEEFIITVPEVNGAKDLEIYSEDKLIGQTTLNSVGAEPCIIN